MFADDLTAVIAGNIVSSFSTYYINIVFVFPVYILFKHELDYISINTRLIFFFDFISTISHVLIVKNTC